MSLLTPKPRGPAMYWEWPIGIWQGVAAFAVLVLYLIYDALKKISKQIETQIKLDHPHVFRDD